MQPCLSQIKTKGSNSSKIVLEFYIQFEYSNTSIYSYIYIHIEIEIEIEISLLTKSGPQEGIYK